MALTVGIIGLPQSGKTSLFNALTRSSAPVSNYPTSTVQANLAVVNVPDERVERLADMFHPLKKTLATVEFVDVAGMAGAAHDEKHEGLNAEFLGHIRNADALAVVVRCFANPTVPHAAGSVDAARDLDDLLLTLTFTDLGAIERRIERTTKSLKSDKKYQVELDLLRRVQHEMEDGALASSLEFTAAERAVIDDLFLLTMKPRLYVANVSEDMLGPAGAI
jgi:ribosome-binding ATPase YchF (GTP1/OBG family)